MTSLWVTVCEGFQLLFAFVTNIVKCLADVIVKVINVNYEVVSKVVHYSSEIFGAVSYIFSTVVSFSGTILQSLIDFVVELWNFFHSFLTLIWKLFVLLYNILDLIFHILESVLYCLWTGTEWTAETMRASTLNVIDSCKSTWFYSQWLAREFVGSVFGGFSTIGHFAKSIAYGIWSGVVWIIVSIAWLVDYCMISIADAVKSAVDSVYYFLTDYIPNLSKETYLGILICCVLYLLILSLANYLASRGMTFPFSRFLVAARQTDHEDGGLGEEFESDAEFSADEDIEEIETDDVDTSEETNESDSDDFETDESDSDEIDIQLPPAGGRHNFRRSTTPSRSEKRHSSDEVEREIELERDKRKCVVCQDNKKSVLILPCRHMCLCVDCGDQIARSRLPERRVCPLCRARIQTIMGVYV